MNPIAASPSGASNGRLGGGGGGGDKGLGRASGGTDFAEGYELTGAPQTVRVKTRARGHTRDLQYAIHETGKINTRLAETQSRPTATHKRRYAVAPPGATWVQK